MLQDNEVKENVMPENKELEEIVDAENKRQKTRHSRVEPYSYENKSEQSDKLVDMEMAKHERENANQRCIPPSTPSVDSFNLTDQIHLNALIDSQNHRYPHQFSGDLTQVRFVRRNIFIKCF